MSQYISIKWEVKMHASYLSTTLSHFTFQAHMDTYYWVDDKYLVKVDQEAEKACKRRRSLLDHKIQQLSKGSSEGSGIILEVPHEPKDYSDVAEKQAGNVQTSLTLSSAKLEIQSMVDVPDHQEDPVVQRTHSLTLLPQRQENLESCVGGRLRDVDYRLIQRTE
ncbi:hypothetical protein Tco_0355899 [Tanacetum coccineum]